MSQSSVVSRTIIKLFSRPLVMLGVALAVGSCSDGPTGPNAVLSGGKLAVGEQTACAIDAAGSLYCWGLNSTRFEYGVSPATTAASLSPVKVPAPVMLTFAVGASQHMCGVSVQHIATCWGRGGLGEMGSGVVDNAGNNFTQVLGSFWASLSVQRLTTCGVTTLGTGLCWGSNQRGEIGTKVAAIGSATNTPVPVEANVKFTQIVTGWLHACGIAVDGQVLCWGDNRFGQLGNGSIDPSTTASDAHVAPTPVSSAERFVSLSSGALQTCGITTNHRAFCWGLNDTGQLGDGTMTTRAIPTAVAGGQAFTTITIGSGFAGGANATPPSAVPGGAAHTCALSESGTAYCWGWNGDGQLGDGSTTDRLTPVAVAGGRTFTSIGAGGAATCAMQASAVWCWGSGRSGQLGRGTTASSSSPVFVLAPFAQTP